MREDMYKVIVERPRRGGGVQGDGRQWRNSRDRGSHLGMTQGYRFGKGLNENLAPLRRWLHQQVHRPWDKVYAELCAGIDRRNTVQAHIYQHLDDFVDRTATWVDGQVMVREWRRGTLRVPLHEASYVELFVHPLTGILLPNRRQPEARKAWRGRRNPAPAPRRIAIDDWTQWHQIDGGWFELELDLLPPAGDRSPQRWDALRECWLTRGSATPQGVPASAALFGRANVYAASKRPLGRAEIRRRFPNGMPA